MGTEADWTWVPFYVYPESRGGYNLMDDEAQDMLDDGIVVENPEYPSGAPDYYSGSGSRYWYANGGVYRVSDHWGSNVGSCDWQLLDYEHENASNSWRDDAGERCGFCQWDDFDFRLMPPIAIIKDDDLGAAAGYVEVEIEPSMLGDGMVHFNGYSGLYYSDDCEGVIYVPSDYFAHLVDSGVGDYYQGAKGASALPDAYRGGNCFETAWDMLMDSVDYNIKSDLLICHGVLDGPIDGYVFTHGWNETGDGATCFDFSNGNEICMNRDMYYSVMGVHPETVHRYDYLDAYSEARRTMKYGPWADELQFEYKEVAMSQTKTSFDVPIENTGGDCFVVAVENMMDDGPGGDMLLAHGIVSGQGALSGIRFVHAWNEFPSGYVLDESNGNSILMPVSQYYEMGDIDQEEVYLYDFEEMGRKILEFGTYGPWESEFMFDYKEAGMGKSPGFTVNASKRGSWDVSEFDDYTIYADQFSGVEAWVESIDVDGGFSWGVFDNGSSVAFGNERNIDEARSVALDVAQRRIDGMPLGYDAYSGKFFDSPLDERMITSQQAGCDLDWIDDGIDEYGDHYWFASDGDYEYVICNPSGYDGAWDAYQWDVLDLDSRDFYERGGESSLEYAMDACRDVCDEINGTGVFASSMKIAKSVLPLFKDFEHQLNVFGEDIYVYDDGYLRIEIAYYNRTWNWEISRSGMRSDVMAISIVDCDTPEEAWNDLRERAENGDLGVGGVWTVPVEASKTSYVNQWGVDVPSSYQVLESLVMNMHSSAEIIEDDDAWNPEGLSGDDYDRNDSEQMSFPYLVAKYDARMAYLDYVCSIQCSVFVEDGKGFCNTGDVSVVLSTPNGDFSMSSVEDELIRWFDSQRGGYEFWSDNDMLKIADNDTEYIILVADEIQSIVSYNSVMNMQKSSGKIDIKWDEEYDGSLWSKVMLPGSGGIVQCGVNPSFGCCTWGVYSEETELEVDGGFCNDIDEGKTFCQRVVDELCDAFSDDDFSYMGSLKKTSSADDWRVGDVFDRYDNVGNFVGKYEVLDVKQRSWRDSDGVFCDSTSYFVRNIDTGDTRWLDSGFVMNGIDAFPVVAKTASTKSASFGDSSTSAWYEIDGGLRLLVDIAHDGRWCWVVYAPVPSDWPAPFDEPNYIDEQASGWGFGSKDEAFADFVNHGGYGDVSAQLHAKTATRQFTYAEMEELDREIEGRELHNRSRLKAFAEEALW